MEFIYSLEMINGTFTPVRKGEIIRCKDCKYFIKSSKNTYGGCLTLLGMTNPKDDDFCSKAERKETDE